MTSHRKQPKTVESGISQQPLIGSFETKADDRNIFQPLNKDNCQWKEENI